MPMIYFQDFGDLLRFIFRKRRGRQFIDRGHYLLTAGNETELTILDASKWGRLVKAGSTITMDIKLQSNADGDCMDSRQCPSCRHLCSYASLGDEVKW
jgi:hypothetical protein